MKIDCWKESNTPSFCVFWVQECDIQYNSPDAENCLFKDVPPATCTQDEQSCLEYNYFKKDMTQDA